MSEFFPSDHSRMSLLAAQRRVSKRAIVEDSFGEIQVIAGVDQAFMDDRIISGIVLLRWNSFDVMELTHSIEPVHFPYITTYLSFREGPAIVSAFKKLRTPPDILMVDGAGINHPRRAGIATHIGVALDIPTIGITKRILCGSGEEPSNVGEAVPLLYKSSQIGWLLKSNKRSRAIIVAPGHKVSLNSSLSIVNACLRGHKLPEPLRLAHKFVNEIKNIELS